MVVCRLHFLSIGFLGSFPDSHQVISERRCRTPVKIRLKAAVVGLLVCSVSRLLECQ